MKTKLAFVVLCNPLSQNHVYKRRAGFGMYMTQKGKDYKELVGYTAKSNMQSLELFKAPSVSLNLYFDNRRKNDIDGPIKLILDSLNGICWEDDSLIKELKVSKMYDKENPRIEIYIQDLNY